jgi:hypothetical protein
VEAEDASYRIEGKGDQRNEGRNVTHERLVNSKLLRPVAIVSKQADARILTSRNKLKAI